MSKINSIDTSEAKFGETLAANSDQTSQYLKYSKLIDRGSLGNVSLKDCRYVEYEFSKELGELAKYLGNPDFGVGPNTIGSELEISLVNKASLLPSFVNLDICKQVSSYNVQPEISKFCLEYNGPVISMQNQPLNTLSNEMQLMFDNLNIYTEEKFNTSLATIGIIPTLNPSDLGMDALTPCWRYYYVDKLLRALRFERDFVIDIDGDDPLHFKWYNTVLAGVNSSYQVHLRVNPQDYNDYYNAAQLASAFVLSLSGNSPMLYGHRLWEESRIPIYEQTVNNHKVHLGAWQEQSRVGFGRGWIKNGAFGLLSEICQLYYPIFPANNPYNDKVNNDAVNSTNKKLGPDLKHVMLHNSSVWGWNRPVYDSADGGHFRIEVRYMPAGPSIPDMVMNTGFVLGLVKGLSKNVNEIISELPFKYAQYNFYQAAQFGLNAKFIWSHNNCLITQETPVTDLLSEMIDLAATGLQELGVSNLEINYMVEGLNQRLESRTTGAQWQKIVYNKLIKNYKLNPRTALQKMFKLYIENQNSGIAVANWPTDL